MKRYGHNKRLLLVYIPIQILKRNVNIVLKNMHETIRPMPVNNIFIAKIPYIVI